MQERIVKEAKEEDGLERVYYHDTLEDFMQAVNEGRADPEGLHLITSTGTVIGPRMTIPATPKL